MKCPHCDSNDVQTFEMAYLQDTSIFKDSLSQRVAPPKEKSAKYGIIFILLGLVFFKAHPIVCTIVILLAIGGLIADYDYNTKKYPVELAQWKKKWICLKCGHEFQEQEGDS